MRATCNFNYHCYRSIHKHAGNNFRNFWSFKLFKFWYVRGYLGVFNPTTVGAGINFVQQGFIFSLVLVQIVFVVLFLRGWKYFICTASARELDERKKEEKAKQRLLFGTLGLNFVTMGFFIVDGAIALYIHLSLEAGDVNVFFNFDKKLALKCIMLIMSFLNGSGGIIFHIIFTKAYRSAFFKTPFGKLFAKFRSSTVTTTVNARANNIRVRPVPNKNV